MLCGVLQVSRVQPTLADTAFSPLIWASLDASVSQILGRGPKSSTRWLWLEPRWCQVQRCGTKALASRPVTGKSYEERKTESRTILEEEGSNRSELGHPAAWLRYRSEALSPMCWRQEARRRGSEPQTTLFQKRSLGPLLPDAVMDTQNSEPWEALVPGSETHLCLRLQKQPQVFLHMALLLLIFTAILC